MASVLVYPAAAHDAEKLVPLYEWLFAPPGFRPADWDRERALARIRGALASDSAVILLARLGEELVGFCSAYEDIESVRFGRRVWVEDLAVHPGHRSAGVGKQLLDAAKVWARDRGADRLGLESSVTRKDAHRFYEREQPSARSLSFGWDL